MKILLIIIIIFFPSMALPPLLYYHHAKVRIFFFLFFLSSSVQVEINLHSIVSFYTCVCVCVWQDQRLLLQPNQQFLSNIEKKVKEQKIGDGQRHTHTLDIFVI